MALKFNVEGRDVGSVITEAQAIVGPDAKVKPPDGHYFVWGGEFENQQRAMARLRLIVPLSIFLIFILLFHAFQSARHASLILLNVPFALVGGVFA